MTTTTETFTCSTIFMDTVVSIQLVSRCDHDHQEDVTRALSWFAEVEASEVMQLATGPGGRFG
jgi:hypothetical protein